MFGSQMSITVPGGLTTTGAGCGIRSVAGPGSLMILGDGVSITTDAGSGASAWAGTGFQPPAGARPGFPGTMAPITTAGVLRATTAIPE
jgi:hypothetical protein